MFPLLTGPKELCRSQVTPANLTACLGADSFLTGGTDGNIDQATHLDRRRVVTGHTAH